MKKLITFAGILIAIIGCSTAKVTDKEQQTIMNKVVKKVSSMQKIIGFTDAKAQKLQKLEFEYLKQLKSLQKSNFSEVELQKNIKKLNKERDTRLQSILDRDEYLKYDAIENNRLKQGVIMAE